MWAPDKSSIFIIRRASPAASGCLFSLIAIAAAFASGPPMKATVQGRVEAESGIPLRAATLTFTDSRGRQTRTRTGRDGGFRCEVSAGNYRISLQRAGYQPIRDRLFLFRDGRNLLHFTLAPNLGPTRVQKVIGFLAPSANARRGPSHPTSNVSDEVQQNLPDISQTMLDRFGDIRTAGAQSLASRYLVDTPNQSRPQDFGLMNIVSPASVSTPDTQSETNSRFGGAPIYEAPAGKTLTQPAANFGGWKAQLSHPFPGIRYQRGLRLGDWAPRLTFAGPFHGKSLWFTDTISAEHALVVVPELPRSADSITAWEVANSAKLQAAFSPHHSLALTFLGSRRLDSHIGLSPFNPIESTVSLGANHLNLGLNDQQVIDRVVIESGINLEELHSALNPQGGTTYVLFPGSVAGSYFETLRGHNQQGRMFVNALMPWQGFFGSHQLQVGLEAGATNYDHFALRQPFQVRDQNGNLEQITNFIGNSQFSLSNTRVSSYAQDTWQPFSRLRLEGGVRADWDRLITFTEISPRFAAAFLPFSNRKTKLFAFWGIYYPALSLSLLGQAEDQLRIDRFYNSGTPEGSPLTSDFTAALPHLRGPHYISARTGVEQEIGHRTFAGLSILWRHQRDGLAYQKLAERRHLEYLPLLNQRRDDYKAFELTVRHAFPNSAELLVSYTRSHSWTNQVFDYDLNSQTFNAEFHGPLAYDAPDRVVSWGWSPVIARSFVLSYLLEYRTGFPFSVVDQDYQLVGQPNSYRFPHVFRLNVGFEKLFGICGRRLGVRFAVLNVTNHGNYTAVDNNIASTTFLQYGGSLTRSYIMRVRLVRDN